MATWLEVHCDCKASKKSPACHSDCGPHVGAMSYANSADGLRRTLQDIHKEARAKGWRRILGEGWFCPSCLSRWRAE